MYVKNPKKVEIPLKKLIFHELINFQKACHLST